VFFNVHGNDNREQHFGTGKENRFSFLTLGFSISVERITVAILNFWAFFDVIGNDNRELQFGTGKENRFSFCSLCFSMSVERITVAVLFFFHVNGKGNKSCSLERMGVVLCSLMSMVGLEKVAVLNIMSVVLYCQWKEQQIIS
jgi:hypothetical protein